MQRPSADQARRAGGQITLTAVRRSPNPPVPSRGNPLLAGALHQVLFQSLAGCVAGVLLLCCCCVAVAVMNRVRVLMWGCLFVCLICIMQCK